jgi:hypothetical protein
VDNIEKNAGKGRPDFFEKVAEIILNITNYLSGPDILTHPGLGIEKAIVFGINNLIFFNPDRVSEDFSFTSNHFKISHDIQDTLDIGFNQFFIGSTQITGFRGDGGLAPQNRCPAEIF